MRRKSETQNVQQRRSGDFQGGGGIHGRGTRRLRQGRQYCLLFPKRAKVQFEIRDVWFQRQNDFDEGTVWPVTFALKELTADAGLGIGALVNRAVKRMRPR